MVAALWSDDPEFYDVILGGSEILEQIFVRINCSEIEKIIERFNLSSKSDDIFFRSDEHKYICVTAETAKEAINKVSKTMKTL